MRFVDIIIPVYNSEKFLDTTLESVANQHKDIEYSIILVNDGSTDNSAEICDKWAGRYDNIIVIHQENKGVSAARNVGIRSADSEYVAFVDSDDEVKCNWISTVYNRNLNKNADIISYGIEDVKDGTIINKNTVEDFYVKTGEEFKKYFTDYHDKILGSVCLKYYKLSLIKANDIKFDEGVNNNEDMLFDYSVLMCSSEILNIDEALYIYKSREASLSKKGDVNQLKTIDKKITAYNLLLGKLGYNDTKDELLHNMKKTYISSFFISLISSTTNYSYRERHSILKALYNDKKYYSFIDLDKYNIGGINRILANISIKFKISAVLAIPCNLKKILAEMR